MLLALLLRRTASGPKRLLFVGYAARSSSSTIGAAATYHTPLHPLSASTHPPSIGGGIVALPPLGGARAMTAAAASGGRRRRRRASEETAPSAGAEAAIAGDSDAAPAASPRRRRGICRSAAAAAPPEAPGAGEGAAPAATAAQAGMADGSSSLPASPSRRQRRRGYAIAAAKSAEEEEEEDGERKGSRSSDGEKQEKDERRRQRRRKQRKGMSKGKGLEEGKVEDGNEKWWQEQEAWAATLPPPSEERAQRLVDGVAQHLGYRFFPHKVFLDQLPEGLTARDIARVFSRLRRPVAAPPVLSSDAGVAGEGAAEEGEEGGEGAVVVATASPDAAAQVPPPVMEGGKVDAVVLLQAGLGARRLFPHWRGRGIDPALAPRAAVIQLGDRATYERALSDDVRIFGIVWQRHVLNPTRRLGKVLRYALQSGDYAIKDIHGPGLSPSPDDDAPSEEEWVVKGAAVVEGEGGAQGDVFDGFAVEEEQEDAAAAAAATPVVTGPYTWGWREGGAAVGVGAAESTVRTVVTVVDGEQRGGGEKS